MNNERYVLNNINVAQFDGTRYVFVRRNITIADGVVVDIGVATPKRKDYSSKVLFPKFFNAHCHLGESLFKSISGKNWTISDYLEYTEKFQNSLSPEKRSSEWMRSAVSVLQDLKGTDTIGFCASRSAEICATHNFNNMSGFPIMNTPKVISYKKSGISGFADYVLRYKNSRCSVGVFLHSLYMNDEKSLELAQDMMLNGAEFLTTHISEDAVTRKKECDKFGQAPIEVLDSYGLIGEKTALVHCGYLNNRELDIVAKRRAAIVVCPISNVFLNTCTVDVRKLTSLGIEWAIATDGLATGRTFDMLKQALFIKRMYPELSYSELFYRMTIVPARLYNRPCYTGCIEKGVSAEFILRDMTDNPLDDLFLSKIDYGEEDIYAYTDS